MFRGYWFAAVAFGLVVLWLPPWSYAQEEHNNRPKTITELLGEIITILQKQSEPDITTQPCRYGEDIRNSDLCAQWKAADAGKQSSNAAWAFGIIGSIIGGLTLFAAFKAAVYAKQAADHTESGAKAARDAVIVTRKAMEVGVKAYVGANKGRAVIVRTPDGAVDHVEITIHWKNYGNSPAKNVRGALANTLVAREEGDELFESMSYGLQKIRPQEDITPENQTDEIVRINGDSAENWLNGKIDLIVAARIVYEDVFENKVDIVWCNRIFHTMDGGNLRTLSRKYAYYNSYDEKPAEPTH